MQENRVNKYCTGCMGAAFGECDTCRHFADKTDTNTDKPGVTAYEADYWVADIRRPGSNIIIPVGIRLWAPSTYEQAHREALYLIATCEPGDTIVRVHKLEFAGGHNETING